MLETVVEKCIYVLTENTTVTEKCKIAIRPNIIKYVQKLNNEQKSNKCNLKCGTRCLFMSLILVDRLIYKGCVINDSNVHNIIITSMILSFKLTEDEPIYDDFFKYIFDLDKSTLLSYELYYLKCLSFNIHIGTLEYNKIVVNILNKVVK